MVCGYARAMGQRMNTIAVLVGAGVLGTLVGVGTTPRAVVTDAPISSLAAPLPPATLSASALPRHDAATGRVIAHHVAVTQPRPVVLAERAPITATVRQMAVATGISRARDPRPGDQWGGCNDARAAGTAPIYRDEPGYRTDMDGDGDGIACEPPRG